MSGVQIGWLADGRRLHLHHGPIDLIVEAEGPPGDVQCAYEGAAACFNGLLEGLVAELDVLRSPERRGVRGPIAGRMAVAVEPFREACFVTPMAAVAGAVADEVCAAMASGGVAKAYVNNGGDIAFYLREGRTLTAALARKDVSRDRVEIGWRDPVRGIATSGWRGRSQSLGIADAVTVLARDAAGADAAATLIANAVDLPGHWAVLRRPAREIKVDSDLGDRLVTTGVGPLAEREVARALERGAEVASGMRARGLIRAAALYLRGDVRVVGDAGFVRLTEGRGEPVTA